MRIWNKWADENYDDPKPKGTCCICGSEIEWDEEAVEISWYQVAHQECLRQLGGEPIEGD